MNHDPLSRCNQANRFGKDAGFFEFFQHIFLYFQKKESQRTARVLHLQAALRPQSMVVSSCLLQILHSLPSVIIGRSTYGSINRSDISSSVVPIPYDAPP